jgi:hypothetical protein
MRKLLLALLVWGIGAVVYAQPGFLVDADWLAEHIDDENLVVLEVRYHLHRCYTVGHIPGAVQVQRFNDPGDNHAVRLMRLLSHEVFEERPLVSVDYVNDPRASIVDALSTMVIDGTQVKVYAWYDNEWG